MFKLLLNWCHHSPAYLVYSYCIVFILISGFQDIFKLAEATTLMDEENTVKLCAPTIELIELSKNGKESSINVDLSPTETKGVCKMRVIAPKTHVVHAQFVSINTEESSLILNRSKSVEHPPCVMSIFLPGAPRNPFWKGDVCSLNSLTEIDLLTPDFKILWWPPSNANYTRGRKLILTAVGQGAVCKESNQHTCMKIGWDPVLCISDNLLCDGIKHCPKSPSTSDEDDNLCRSDFISRNSWRQLAIEYIKKKWPKTKQIFPETNNNNDDLFNTIKSPFTEITKSENKTTTTKTTKPEAKLNDNLSQVLSKYGPWGYLMLGMLICGTVLLFCGLWECCIKKPKTPIEAPPHCTQQPTTVLIINQQQQQNSEDAQPPSYDDLDQPPSYVTLFPNTNSFKQNSNRQEEDDEESASDSSNNNNNNNNNNNTEET